MKKVTLKNSPAILNTIEVKIENESYTVAAPIIERLNSNKHCEYASYRIEHPTDKFVSLRIKSDDSENVVNLFKGSISSIISDIDDIILQVRQAHI